MLFSPPSATILWVMPLFTFTLQNGVALMVPVHSGDALQTSNAAAESGDDTHTQQEEQENYWLWHAGVLMGSSQNRSPEWRVEE